MGRLSSPAELIEHASQRILRQHQMNVLGFFLPLAVATSLLCWVLLPMFSLPFSLAAVPFLLIGGFTSVALWRTKRVVKKETVAALIDEKTSGQERFLTLATFPETQKGTSFFALLQRQAEGKTALFVPSRDLPFTVERRVKLAVAGSILCSLALLFVPPLPPVSPLAEEPLSETVLAELQEAARTLMAKGATPQEQAAGAQLLVLAEELKNPELSPQEKQRLIEETQKRLNLPLPQLFPLKLKLFASKSQNDKGEGNESDQSQSDNKPLSKTNQNSEQLKKSLSAAAGNEPQPGPPKDEEKKEQQKPRAAGGGIKFDQPQQKQGEKKERSDRESSGEQQKSSQNQTPNNQAPGADPNQPGGQNTRGQDPKKKGPSPQQPGQEKGTGSMVGGGRGERFLKPGEQPGGFLTKDVRFVKVRIPVGNEPQSGGDKLTENYDAAQPKTPYSNAPLKEGLPDQVQLKQPIPLEYRAILQK